MDILSHGLWAVAGAGAANRAPRLRSGNILPLRWTFFWGIFPDLFAFTAPFIWLVVSMAMGALSLADWPAPERVEPVGHDQWPIFRLATTLYNYSHSMIIFGIVGIVVLLYCLGAEKPIPLEMLGWPLHILMDVPTHSYRFFPTPVLWPISQWKFDGFSWVSPWFLAVNYGALVIVLSLLRLYAKKANHS